MKRSFIAAALAGVALVSFEAQAQVSAIAKPVQFGIAAGAALPTSDLSDAASTGFNVTGTIGINPQLIPLGIRIDGAYNRFSLKNGVSGDIHFTSVTGNRMPLSGFDTFIEARYNQVQGDNGSLKYIPITFGLMF